MSSSTKCWSDILVAYAACNRNSSFWDDLEDSVRRMCEACNRPSGFSLFTDISNGFSGIAMRYGEYLMEEYPKRAVFTSSFSSPDDVVHENLAISHINFLTLTSMLESNEDWPSTSMYLPTSFTSPYIQENCLQCSKIALGINNILSPVQLQVGKSPNFKPEEMHSLICGFQNVSNSKHMLSAGVALDCGFDLTKSELNHLLLPSECSQVAAQFLFTRGPVESKFKDEFVRSYESSLHIEKFHYEKQLSLIPQGKCSCPILKNLGCLTSLNIPDAVSKLEEVYKTVFDYRFLSSQIKNRLELEDDQIMDLKERVKSKLLEFYG